MRSIAEIGFRTRQEASNLFLLAFQPNFSGEMPVRLTLPDGDTVANALRQSDYAAFVKATARQILAHRFPLLGVTIETDPEIR